MSNIIDKIQLSGVTYDIGGGGSSYSAGTGIDITNSVISISLPISAGTGSNSIIEGYTGNTASGEYSHAEGYNTTASTDYVHAEGYSTKASGLFAHAEGGNTSANGTYSHAEGNCTITTNKAEHASGQFNTSNKANTTFGDSGNTLFSVGNGTSNNARHNAFEIRQNGDIYISSGGTDIKLQDYLGGGGSSYTAGDGIDITSDVISVTGKVDTSTYNTYTAATDNRLDEVEQVTAQALNVLNDRLDEDEEVTAAALNNLNESLSGKADTATTYTKTETNTLLGSKADTATTYTKTEVDNAITAATSTKQDTLVSGTNIKTINNTSILGSGNIDIQGGGGKAIEAGRGISVTTGATADTISVSLPISAGTGMDSVKEGYSGNSAAGNFSHVEGYSTSAGVNGYVGHAEGYVTNANGRYSHAEGKYTIATNDSEHASGQYNVSSSGSSTFGHSGNTLFSIGNGTGNNARHNALEVRQNGDIWVNDGTNDVKLQDTITATAANTTALGGLKLVKLTQSEYNALAPNYDSNTLYVIVN